jgi:hypothetical protein
MSRALRNVVAALVLLAAASFASMARATAEENPEKIVAAAVHAAQAGAFDDAVDRLELLADRGFVHPDASYARAFAYVERARSRAAHPGDLGRAAAALEEYRLLRPGDDAVDSALETLRSEISRRRARSGNTPVVERPALGRAVAELLPENVWAGVTILGSVLTTCGLALYFWLNRRATEIAGATALAAGLLFGFVGGALTLAARHYRMSSRPAVVVVPEARLLDETGRILAVRAPSPSAVPEGELVHVREQREGRAHVEWGTVDAWVDTSQLRFVGDIESSHS